MAKALAVHNGKLIATPKGILVVDDAAEEPCCWCVVGCAWVIVPKTVEVTVDDVFHSEGDDPPSGESCDQCDDYNGVYELPHVVFIGGEINRCGWEDTFIETCTRVINDLEGNTCDLQMYIQVGLGACINEDGDCEVWVTVTIQLSILMGTCDPAVIGLSAGANATFGEDGDGCGYNCTAEPFAVKRKRIAIAEGADCTFIDIRGETLTIDLCSYNHTGNVQPTCFNDGGGSVTIQF